MLEHKISSPTESSMPPVGETTEAPVLVKVSSVRKYPLEGEAEGFKLVVCMCGLPARGKTYLAKKINYYVNWIHGATECRVFNLGEYRRRAMGAKTAESFFDPGNEEAKQIRERFCEQALTDIATWLDTHTVAILDACNTTKERREHVKAFFAARGIEIFFVETVCENDAQIHDNILTCKVGLPDFQQLSVEAAVADFKERIVYYRMKYEPLSGDTDPNCSFIQLVDVGRYFVLHQVKNYLEMRISRFLMNLHITPRHIYLTRHGESEFNQKQLIGGDSALSENGVAYAKALKVFMEKEGLSNLKVWTSTLKRTMETASHVADRFESWRSLDELDAGECDGMTYEEIEERYPEIAKERDDDKYYARYPRGESYADVVQRLEPRILELERLKENVLVICHQAVARCLLAYFQEMEDLEHDLPYLKIPLHTVIKITPIPYGNRVQMFPLGIDCVSTHRDKPQSSPSK